MGTLFRHAFSRSRGAILGWGLILGVLGGYLMLFYDTLAEQQEQFAMLLESYPKELLAFFGGMEEIFTPAGFLNVEYFSYMPLILGIFALLAGTGMLVADEESGIMDLILAYPLSRSALFLGRLLAVVISTTSIMILMYAGLFIGMQGSTIGLTWDELARPFLSLVAVLFLISSLSLLLSVMLPSRRLAGMMSGILLVASFFITSLQHIDERLEQVAKLSPLNYYQGGEAINGMNWQWFTGLLGFAIVFTLLAWWRFERRDIRVAGEGGWRFVVPWRRMVPAEEQPA